MLSETQIDVITMLSAAVWFGFVGGAPAGAIAGALIRPLRTRSFFSFLSGSCRSAFLGAVIAIGVSLVAVILEMILCERGYKGGGWDVPVWAAGIQLIAILIGGVIGAFLPPRQQALQLHTAAVWALAGAFLGALAHLDRAFDGYYALHSNARPLRHAIIGMLVGGVVVSLWRFLIDILERRTDETASA